MIEFMKSHFATIGALMALAMILGTILILSLRGHGPDKLAMLGLGTALGTIVSGFAPSFQSKATPDESRKDGAKQ